MPSTASASPADSAPRAQSPERRFSAPWIIFWVALAVRVLYITFGHTYRIPNFEDHIKFGYEMGRIARSVAMGHGYASPFNMPTGPTAWEPPLYPLLMAGVFKLFGVYTALSAWVILSLNSVFSAATAMFIYPIAARCYNRKVAVWSAWIWALYPACMQYAVRWIWEMALTAMLLTAVLALALKMRRVGEDLRERAKESLIKSNGGPPKRSLSGEQRNRFAIPRLNQTFPKPSTRQWLLFGLLWGLIALSNPAVLIFLPACGLWVLLGAFSWTGFARAVASGLVFIAVVSPWTIRNYRVFHAFVPFRTNFGAELAMANGSGFNGMEWGMTVQGKYQTSRYKELGELRYAREQRAIAKAWIRSHPKRFAELSLKRFYFFWSTLPHPATRHESRVLVRDINYCVPNLLAILGIILSFRRCRPAAALFLWAFILLPLVYYFVIAEARFRSPLEPLMVVLIVFAVRSAERSWAVRPSVLHRKRDTIA